MRIYEPAIRSCNAGCAGIEQEIAPPPGYFDWRRDVPTVARIAEQDCPACGGISMAGKRVEIVGRNYARRRGC